MRDARPNTFSIERLYEDVRSALPPIMEAEEWVCRNPSKGILSRLRDALTARKMQGDVNHVTGDTHYLTYFLDKKRTILTIHDLVSYERVAGWKRFVFWFFWFWLPVNRSSLVVAVSESTRQALLKAVRCDPAKVVVIHNPVSAEFKPSPNVFNAVCPRILQVGTKSNKNIPRIAQALSGLSCRLIIIGPLSHELRCILDQYKIHYENYVGLSRNALMEQYVKADMLMFASTYEGFGLPIIEANVVGRPVITSSFSPMTEVANSAAAFVNPFDSVSIRAGVQRVITDDSYRNDLIKAGYENAQRYSLAIVASKYTKIYSKIAEANAGESPSMAG